MTSKKLIEVLIEICNRCGEDWIPRKSNPLSCPKCKSPYWNKERVYPKKVIDPVEIIK